MNEMEKVLSENVKVFVAFARKRVGDQEVAEDIVQDSVLKALKATRIPTSEGESMVWFYRILRRSIIDVYRRNETRKRFVEKFEQSLPEHITPEDHAAVCRCYKRLLPLIPKNYRVMLERIDLEGESVSDVATSLDITENALHVRLHRARKALRVDWKKPAAPAANTVALIARAVKEYQTQNSRRPKPSAHRGVRWQTRPWR